MSREAKSAFWVPQGLSRGPESSKMRPEALKKYSKSQELEALPRSFRELLGGNKKIGRATRRLKRMPFLSVATKIQRLTAHAAHPVLYVSHVLLYLQLILWSHLCLWCYVIRAPLQGLYNNI